MVISATLTGCGPSGGSAVASSSSKAPVAKDGPKYAKKAKKALAKGQTEKAIMFAERSVASVGDNADSRALLGHAYVAAGRFSSAERSLLDAVELGNREARTVLTLAMTQLGQGKADKAKRVLMDNRQFIPTADYGLALALAGDSKTAVDVLERAIRNADATGRTRQNLGLAYALDGRWKEAKLMAVQDMTPETISDRMMQWAQLARPGAYQTRVASLLNVTPVAGDPGQPVRLALNGTPAATPAQDYRSEVASFDRNAPLPAIGPAPRKAAATDFMAKENNVKVAAVAIPASKPASKTTVAPTQILPEKTFIVEEEGSAPRASAPVRTASLQAISSAKPIMQKIAFAPKARTISASPASSGTHLVQLGAFSSAEGAKRAWGILSSKNTDLAAFQYASSAVNVKGKTLYRLAAMGFGNAQTAKDMCVGIKAKGGSCIVRHVKGVNKSSPTRMASQAPRKLAAR
jgi:Flp pilus assembly protein TadD/cell division protein FtsN